MYAANYSYHNNISFDLNAPTSDAIDSDGIEIEFKGTNGNQTATDPQFKNPGNSKNSDFHLKSGSSAINAGTIIFGTAKTDLDGKIRVAGKINKGAY
jgi:hypothetical protein